MMRFFHSLAACLVAVQCFSQDNLTYFDSYWNKISSIEGAEYYRIVERRDDHYLVRDFYMSGVLQMIGKFSLLEPEIKEGYFIWYYSNGKKYCEGNFIHGQREGDWVYWFPDGLKKEVIKCYPGKEFFTRKWKSKRVKRSQDIFTKAMQKKKKKNYELALRHFDDAIKVNPYFAEAFFERGEIKCIQNNIEEGCKDVLKAKEYKYPDTKSISQMLETYCK